MLAPVNFGNQGRIQEGGRLSPFVFGGNGPVVHQPHQEQPRLAPFIFGGNIPANQNQEEGEQGHEQARPVQFDFAVRAHDHEQARVLQADRLQHEKDMVAIRFKYERKLVADRHLHERRMLKDRHDRELRKLELVNKVFQNEDD
jgi:hypothetical protein